MGRSESDSEDRDRENRGALSQAALDNNRLQQAKAELKKEKRMSLKIDQQKSGSLLMWRCLYIY